MPNTALTGHDDRDGEQGQLQRRQRVGFDQRREPARRALGERRAQHHQQRQHHQRRHHQHRQRDQRPAQPCRFLQDVAGSGRQSRPLLLRRSCANSDGIALIASRQTNDAASSSAAIATAPWIVVLLQADGDQQRRDLGLVGQVAGDEDHRAVLAQRARERQRETGQQRRQQLRQDTRRSVVRREAPSEAAASSCSWPSASSTGCTVRTANGRPMNTSAMTMPIGV